MMKKAFFFLLMIFACVLMYSVAGSAGSIKYYQAIPIYRAADTYDWTHSYFSYPQPFSNFLNQSNTHIDDGIAGYISQDCLPGTVPLYKMKYSLDTYLAPGDEVRDALIIKYGYYNEGILGYVPPADSPLGDRNMNLWFRGRSGNHAYNDQDHYYDAEAHYIPSYAYEGTPFRVWSSPVKLQEIMLVEPAANSVLKGGEPVVIKWSSIISEGRVTLLYSKNGNMGPWITIKEDLPANSSYSWTVPNESGNNIAITAEWSYSSAYGKAIRQDVLSPLSIKASVGAAPGGLIIKPIYRLLIPSAPSNLTASGDLLARKVSLYWQDNSDSEGGFIVERKEPNGQFSKLAQTTADVNTYIDSSAKSDIKYVYRVKAIGTIIDSSFSNEAVGGYSTLNFQKPDFKLITPQAPQNLTVSSQVDSASAQLAWSAVNGNISGYMIERKIDSSDVWELIGKVPASSTSYQDIGLSLSNTYTYRIRSYDSFLTSNPSNEVSVTLRPADSKSQTTLKNTLVFHIGKPQYSANGKQLAMDVEPAVINDRTFLPIRFITTPMNAELSWNGDEEKVTIAKGNIIIELWINSNTAKVNGTSTLIDTGNSSVMPVLVNERTMLPLRFIAEKLGCEVKWDTDTSSITISY